LRASFDASVDAVQLTISAYFLALAATQLVYGALSDRLGRRPLLLAALALFGLAGIGCAFAPSLPVLVMFRALQGVGAAGCMVLTRAVIGDAFQGQVAMRMMSFAMLAPPLVSLIGPLSGGWLLAGLGWHGVFAAIAAAGVATAVFALFRLPETIAARDSGATSPGQIWRNCLLFAATPQAMIFSATTSLSAASIYLYSSTLSFVLIEVFGISSSNFGWFPAMTGAAMMAGGWYGGKLSEAMRGRALRAAAVCALVAAAAVLAACLKPLPGALGITAIMLPMTVYGFCVGLFTPMATVIVVKAVPSIAGIASAILGTMMMSCGALFVWVGGLLYDGTPSALGIGVAIAASIWITLHLTVGRRWI